MCVSSWQALPGPLLPEPLYYKGSIITILSKWPDEYLQCHTIGSHIQPAPQRAVCHKIFYRGRRSTAVPPSKNMDTAKCGHWTFELWPVSVEMCVCKICSKFQDFVQNKRLLNSSIITCIILGIQIYSS